MPELLACPDCSGPLKNEGALLRCGCATWPVVADIPILARWARNRQFSVEEALARHLPMPAGLGGKILRRLFPGTGSILKAISRRDTPFLDLAAALGRTRDLDYFRYRFSDLSFITTSAMLTPLTQGPVLDLGCGAGHTMHALLRRLPRSLIVGLDLNFTLLYLAKRFLAPGALLICADGSTRLPFVDQAFEASVCADTFKYLPDRSVAAAELLRVTRGPIVVSHFYDPSFQGEGVPAPLEPGACLDLFSSRSPKLHREKDILENFLSRRELDLSGSGATREDMVSLSAGLEPRVYPGADYFVSGSQLNPIYESREENGAIRLSRKFVSDHYTQVYRNYEAYFPENLVVTAAQIAERDPELVRRFVLLDLPPNYC